MYRRIHRLPTKLKALEENQTVLNEASGFGLFGKGQQRIGVVLLPILF